VRIIKTDDSAVEPVVKRQRVPDSVGDLDARLNSFHLELRPVSTVQAEHLTIEIEQGLQTQRIWQSHAPPVLFGILSPDDKYTAFTRLSSGLEDGLIHEL
jgi:hypothetical protein